MQNQHSLHKGHMQHYSILKGLCKHCLLTKVPQSNNHRISSVHSRQRTHQVPSLWKYTECCQLISIPKKTSLYQNIFSGHWWWKDNFYYVPFLRVKTTLNNNMVYNTSNSFLPLVSQVCSHIFFLCQQYFHYKA